LSNIDSVCGEWKKDEDHNNDHYDGRSNIIRCVATSIREEGPSDLYLIARIDRPAILIDKHVATAEICECCAELRDHPESIVPNFRRLNQLQQAS